MIGVRNYTAVRLPEQKINPSSIKIYLMTTLGHQRFQQGVPINEQREGIDFVLDKIISYTPIKLEHEGKDKDGKYKEGYYYQAGRRYKKQKSIRLK